jgi:hypothetical protein
MKKLAFVFAAIAVAALTGASAEELGARVGDRDMSRDRDFRAARAEVAYGEHDRGLHRGRAGAHRAYGRSRDRNLSFGSPYEEAHDKQNRPILSTFAECGRRRCQWPRWIRLTFTSGSAVSTA